MHVNCTLQELIAFMEASFTENAIKIARLDVNIQVHDMRQLTKTYPQGLDAQHYPAFDAAIELVDSGKVHAIKAVRAVTNWDLKVARDFVEKWFPEAKSL